MEKGNRYPTTAAAIAVQQVADLRPGVVPIPADADATTAAADAYDTNNLFANLQRINQFGRLHVVGRASVVGSLAEKDDFFCVQARRNSRNKDEQVQSRSPTAI